MKYAPSFASIANRLRARGFTVIEQEGWRDRGHRDFISIESVTLHHTADTSRQDYRSLKTVTYGRSDLPGPLCNWGVGREGTIYLVSAGVAWHTGATFYTWQSNNYAVGIEAENDGRGEPWGPEILAAYVALCQELRDEFRVPVARFLGHKEIAKPLGRKPDPANLDLAAFRLRVAQPIEEEDLTPEQARQLAEVHRELTQRLNSRVPGSTTSDTIFGTTLNADANAYTTLKYVQSVDFLEAVARRVVDALLNTRVSVPTYRNGVVANEDTALRETWARGGEASAVYHLLTNPVPTTTLKESA